MGIGVLALAFVAVGAASFLAQRFPHPFPASTLDFTGGAAQYADAPFSAKEAAGIGLLTSLGAVEGYGDGAFRPADTLNRAEFLKIVLKSSHRSADVPLRSARCFPDVGREDWFSPFVCFGKERGIVAGYPDGLFRPGNPVNHAEALKMLVELYGYPRTAVAGETWFSPYARAAKERGVFLLSDLSLNAPLTRGQMARLAAAFRAEHEGELAAYLERERGADDDAQEDIDAQEGQVSSPAQEESSSTFSHAAVLEPVRSRQLLLGEVSPLIARGTFPPLQDSAVIRRIHLRFESAVKSPKAVRVLDAAGETLGVLRVDTNDTQERRNWLLEFDPADAPGISGGEETVLSFSTEIERRGMGGVPGELLRVQRMSMILQNPAVGVSWEVLPVEQVFPLHQTVQARIAAIHNVLDDTGTLGTGAGKVVAAFSFTGELLPETSLSVEEFQFSVEETGVAASRWRLERDGAGAVACFRNSNDAIVACPIVEGKLGVITGEPAVFRLIADVQAAGDTGERALRVSLHAAGSIGESGALRWSDGTGRYNWVDLPEPLAAGTRWEVK